MEESLVGVVVPGLERTQIVRCEVIPATAVQVRGCVSNQQWTYTRGGLEWYRACWGRRWGGGAAQSQHSRCDVGGGVEGREGVHQVLEVGILGHHKLGRWRLPDREGMGRVWDGESVTPRRN